MSSELDEMLEDLEGPGPMDFSEQVDEDLFSELTAELTDEQRDYIQNELASGNEEMGELFGVTDTEDSDEGFQYTR